MTPSERRLLIRIRLHLLNQQIRKKNEAWRRDEMPKERVALLAGDIVPYTALVDQIVTAAEIEALGFVRDHDSRNWRRPAERRP